MTYLQALLILLLVLPTGASRSPHPDSQGKLRVLIVTGGHGFDREPFFDMFRANKEIVFEEVAHPNAHALLTSEATTRYDVIVLYDMWQPITEEAKTAFVNLLKRGKGLVALHHSLCGYNDWPEYAKIIGGRYRMKKEVVNGVERPGSVYKHDVKFRVHVADPKHPVTQGLKDFDVLDETYGDFDVDPKVHPLLTTDEPTSTKTIGWTHTYGKSRVVYIQIGHGPSLFADPNYRTLVSQAIRWVAAKTHRDVDFSQKARSAIGTEGTIASFIELVYAGHIGPTLTLFAAGRPAVPTLSRSSRSVA